MFGIFDFLRIGGILAIVLGGVYVWNNYTVIKKSEIGLLQERIEYLEEDLTQCRADKITLEYNLDVRNMEIANLEGIITQQQEDFQRMQADIAELARKEKASRRELDALVKLFREHDLGYLINQRPGLIESRINFGTQQALENLEEITGASP